MLINLSRHALGFTFRKELTQAISWVPSSSAFSRKYHIGGRGRSFAKRRDSRNAKYDDREARGRDDGSLLKQLRSVEVIRPPEEDFENVTLELLKEEKLIDNALHKAVSRMNFPSLTPVQQKTIKPVLQSENDVIARAKTGTGKTLAFLMPIIQHLINHRKESPYMVKCVIISPTRDLALQIESEYKKIQDKNYGLSKFKSMALIGGTNFDASMRKMFTLRPNIIVATPGRLNDVLSKFSHKFFRSVDFKVLDEADRLLEIGFEDEVKQISNTLNEINNEGPQHIRTLFFSATLGDNVQGLAEGVMNREKCLFLDTIDKNEPEAHEKVAQKLVICQTFAENVEAPINHVKQRLSQDDNYKAIIFVPTVSFTSFYCNLLKRLFPSFPIFEFHGKIDQKKRTRLVQEFKKLRRGLFVCTDVGARGLDFPGVEEVLQVGVPSELSNYVHRIGRTARAGKEGKATSFLFKEELPFVDLLSSARKIFIKDQSEYIEDPVLSEEVTEGMQSSEELSNSLQSLLSFYRANGSSYHFNNVRIARQIASSYGQLLKDSDLKIRCTEHDANLRFGIRGRLAHELFDLGTRRNYDDFYEKTPRNSRATHRSSRASRSHKFDERNFDKRDRRRSEDFKERFNKIGERTNFRVDKSL
ncbi:LAMI_0H18800g1_1 [Lachancea mirantina]|uniref:ATP-dependent RNA helicase n=1 Tax=Lachancea mirantina TaxID=1230905 RepID=A0A1G4KJV3_9SACH|nr:LAMI_0H18800g1_1 [Lachancea mirantina]